MLVTALALCWLPSSQDVGSVATFVWPPPSGAPLEYRVQLAKKRELAPELRDAERAARRDAELFAPSRPPRQQVDLTIEARLVPGERELTAHYAVRLDRETLRVDVVDPTSRAIEPPDPPEPAAFVAAWGPPADKRSPAIAVPRSAIEKRFEHAFRRTAEGSLVLAPIPGATEQHLLPVMWEAPLPCWLEHVVSVVDLSGVAVIDGKSLIQERIDFTAAGSRTSRAEVEFSSVSSDGFTLRYELAVDQKVDRTADGKSPHPVPFVWRLTVEGEAKYLFAAQVFDSVHESVTGDVVDPSAAKLCALTHEAFAGEITVERVADNKRRRRRR